MLSPFVFLVFNSRFVYIYSAKIKITQHKGDRERMKKGIHPPYKKAVIACVCGNTFETRSTVGGVIKVEICSNCHPFFTGKQKFVDTAGRVERFMKRYGKDYQKLKGE